MKKILLINPHETEQIGYSNPPLGLLYLAGILINNGFNVSLVDGCLDGKESIARAIEEFRPAMVGITCLTPGRKKALEVVKMVKNNDSSTTVVLGGVHPTIMYRQMLEHYSDIDFIVIGEGEITFLELAQGKKHPEIDGLAYRDATGIVKTHPREYIQDLDTISFPAWHLVDLKRYPARGDIIFRGIDLRTEPRISVIFSRGCKGRCDFCSTWWIWKGWRHRSAINMVDEIELLYRDFNIKHFCFADDAMTVDRQATIDLCDEIMARNLHIAFHVTTRTDCIDELVLEKLKTAGCYQIAFGVETGSPLLLEKMGKENDIETSERAIKLSKKVGIPATALMIVGNVGEQVETINQTISFLQRARPNDLGCVGGLWILPGTKLYQDCKRNGYIDDDFWLGDEPYKIYTLEWSLEDLAKMQQLVFNYNGIENTDGPMSKTDKEYLESTFLQKWRRYAKADVNEYSATTVWIDAQEQHLELMQKIPSCCKKILDLGCGDGWSTYSLQKMGMSVIGVTINPKEAEHALTKYGLQLVVSDMHDLPLDDHMFDCIYCRESYEHSIAPYIALCEMNRVLRLNGYALINLPWDDWIREDSHYSVFTPSQMREMFYKCRFVIEMEGVTSHGHFWYLGRKVAEIGESPPYPPPVPGNQWFNGVVIDKNRDFSVNNSIPRIIAMLRIKNEEDWIIPTLEKASPFVAGFIILDDGSTDRTQELCKSFPKVLRYVYQNEPVKDEARDKDRLLNWALDEDPDWILALDGDELLEDAAPLAILHEIAVCPQQVTALGFNFLYMWDDHGKYRVDNKYQNLRHPRLFKVKGLGIDPRELRFKTTDHGANFHCGSIPANLPGHVRYIDLNVKHYGYFEKQQRERKKAFYVKHDPENSAKGYYDHLTSEEGIVLLHWKERSSPENTHMDTTLQMLNTIFTSLFNRYIDDSHPIDRRMSVLQANNVGGMGTENISLVINEIVKQFARKGVYLEVGIFQGKSLLSAALYNSTTRCIGIDNFSQFNDGLNETLLNENIGKFDSLKNIEYYNGDYKQKLVELFAREPNLKIDVYYYDGNHSYEDQLDGLNIMLPHLSDNCVILVDDINWGFVEKANDDFVMMHPEFKSFLKIKSGDGTRPGHESNWWNGFQILYRGKNPRSTSQQMASQLAAFSTAGERSLVAILYRHTPMTVGRMFKSGLRQLGADFVSMGWFGGNKIGWPTEYTYDQYLDVPDIPLEDSKFYKVSDIIEKVRYKCGRRPALVLQIDGDVHVCNDLGDTDIKFVTIATDPHGASETYQHAAECSQHFYSMQSSYMHLFSSAKYVAYGYDPEMHFVEPNTIKKYDIACIGVQSPMRVEMARRLREAGFSVRFENGPILSEYRRILNESWICFNQSVGDDLNMRVFESLACGTLLISNRTTDMGRFFKEGTDYVSYRTDDEAIEKVRYYLNHTEELLLIARSGHQTVMEHTYANRLKQIFTEIEFPFGEEPTSHTVSHLEALPQYYSHVRPEILAAVPEGSLNILDVGCGAGLLGKAIKEQNPSRRVTGIEFNHDAYFLARQNLDIAYHSDLETFVPPFTTGQFDCIIFADVLEHLKDPWEIAKQYATFLKPGGTLIASIPNIRRLSILKDLAEDGLWQYQDEGILDRTHLRFFTRKQFLELLNDVKIVTHSVTYLRGEELAYLKPDSNGNLRYGNLGLFNVSSQEFAELCALQIMFTGTYQPDSALQALQVQRAQHKFTASIIIPVFNKVEFTQKCIHSVIRNTAGINFEVIIIDNNSEDGTKEYLTGLSGDVKVVTNDENVGYTIACNQGARIASGKHLVFLNNDTEPQPGWLEQLIALAESDATIGAVGAKLVYPNGVLQEAGGMVFRDARGWNFGNGDNPDKAVYNRIYEVDYCSGACLLVKHDLFNKIGGFDEQYAPAYYEETDLCFSLRKQGYKTLYNPDALVIHHESVTAGTDMQKGYKRFIEINRIKFLHKWHDELMQQEPHPFDTAIPPVTPDRARLV